MVPPAATRLHQRHRRKLFHVMTGDLLSHQISTTCSGRPGAALPASWPRRSKMPQPYGWTEHAGARSASRLVQRREEDLPLRACRQEAQVPRSGRGFAARWRPDHGAHGQIVRAGPPQQERIRKDARPARSRPRQAPSARSTSIVRHAVRDRSPAPWVSSPPRCSRSATRPAGPPPTTKRPPIRTTTPDPTHTRCPAVHERRGGVVRQEVV